MVTLKGHCVGEVHLSLRQDAELSFSGASCCLDSKRQMQTSSVATVPGTWVPAVHSNCWHNEVAAFAMRSLGPTPGSAEGCRRPVLDAFGRLRRVASRYGGSRWGYLETANSYTGVLRSRYLEAERSLMFDGPVRSSDVKLRAFLKAEKRRPDSLAKPRMILPRSPRYNLEVATWLKPFEHWLWGNLKSRAISGVGNSRVVAKGLNQTQRANLIVRKMRTIPDCVVFEVDGRAFEAHVDAWQLLQEHSVYESAYPGDGSLKKILNKQLRNFGVTSNGVRFSREGGRASGDFNTGMGNTLVMLAVVMGTMSQIGPVCWDTLVDGDNALIFIGRSDRDRVCAEFGAVATEISGHEMTLERPTGVVEEVRFGQSAPLRVKGGWQMVRDWRKVVSQSTSSHHHLREPRFALEYLRGVAACESFLAGGVPILWAYTQNLLRRTESVGGFRRHFLRDYQVLGVPVESLEAVYAEEPDDEARQSFALAFDVTPEQQRNIEMGLMGAVVVTNSSAPLDVSDVYGLTFE